MAFNVTNIYNCSGKKKKKRKLFQIQHTYVWKRSALPTSVIIHLNTMGPWGFFVFKRTVLDHVAFTALSWLLVLPQRAVKRRLENCKREERRSTCTASSRARRKARTRLNLWGVRTPPTSVAPRRRAGLHFHSPQRGHRVRPPPRRRRGPWSEGGPAAANPRNPPRPRNPGHTAAAPHRAARVLARRDPGGRAEGRQSGRRERAGPPGRPARGLPPPLHRLTGRRGASSVYSLASEGRGGDRGWARGQTPRAVRGPRSPRPTARTPWGGKHYNSQRAPRPRPQSPPQPEPHSMPGHGVPPPPPAPRRRRPHLHDASALRPLARPGPAEDEDDDGLHEEKEAAAEQQQDSGGGATAGERPRGGRRAAGTKARTGDRG